MNTRVKIYQLAKKSYALSFSLESIEKTLTDKEIDNVMKKLIKAFELKLGAEVRM